MKIQINSKNPYKNARKAKFHGAKAYLVEKLRERKSWRHLDFGAYDGSFILTLKQYGLISKGVGLDANSNVVERHQNNMLNDLELKPIKTNSPLPYKDSSFSSVSIIGVLEHVVEQKKILRELHRVLKPDGVILIAVPGQHFFSWLDMGNWKFKFPKIHEKYIVHTKGEAFFRIHYSDNPDGLYGDVEKEKFWHQHFSKNELKQITEECGFSTIEIDGFGFVNRVIANIAYFSPKFLTKFFNKLIELDARYFDSTEIWIFAKK